MARTETDWKAIQTVTGMTDEEIGALQATWNRGLQTMEEVREGVLWERRTREMISDRPGGLTEQIKSAI